MKKSDNNRKVRAEIRPLKGGGCLVVENMPALESFTLGFFFRVGAAHETKDESGISHFIEHMLFKGTKRRSPKQIVQAIERLGGIINASTGRELTYYFVRIGADHLEVAVDVLADLVFNPLFDPESLEREKSVVLEEMRMNEDDPGQALFERFLRAVHGNTGFGRPILGSEQTVNAFKPAMVRRYHSDNYTPSTLTASIAGGVDPDKVQNLLEKKLAQFDSRIPKSSSLDSPPVFRQKICAYSKDIEQASLIVGFPSSSITSSDRYCYSILDAITAGGMMSRLFQEIREKRGLVYSIDSSQQPYTKKGIFTVEAAMREDNLIKVLKLILREFALLADSGPGKRELQDAKLYLRGQWALGLENSSARMTRNAISRLFFNRILSHDEVIEQLMAVTREDIARVAGRMFIDNGPAVGVISRFDDGKLTNQFEKKIKEVIESSRPLVL